MNLFRFLLKQTYKMQVVVYWSVKNSFVELITANDSFRIYNSKKTPQLIHPSDHIFSGGTIQLSIDHVLWRFACHSEGFQVPYTMATNQRPIKTA